MSEGRLSSREPPKAIGLIALDRDVVIEDDLHRLVSGRMSIVTTRIPLPSVGSLDDLERLRHHLPGACRLLSASSPSVVAFGCTSGVAVIGAGSVHDDLQREIPDVASVDPLSAMAAGLESLGVGRVSLVTPYRADISGPVAAWLELSGFRVVADVRIDPGGAAHYAEIAEGAIVEAVRRAVSDSTEGVVIACTDLRAVELIDEIERDVRVPILTSNQALAWAASTAAGVDVAGVGSLFGTRAIPYTG